MVIPLTAAENSRIVLAERYYLLARRYASTGSPAMALAACKAASARTFGIAKPLAVRDQIHDLRAQLEASMDVKEIRVHPVSGQIRVCGISSQGSPISSLTEEPLECLIDRYPTTPIFRDYTKIQK